MSTSGTLVVGMALIQSDRRNRATDEADNLRATLDLEGTDYSQPSDLAMTICNFGRTTFWDVRAYRCAHVVSGDGSQSGFKWYLAELDYIDANSTYKWLVEPNVTLGTNRAPHPRSFETFVHRGVRYARYRRQPLQRIGRRRNRKDFDRQVAEFEERDDLEVLRYGDVKVIRGQVSPSP